ncbi:MAG: hypothetical protein AB8B55_15270 [Mariniblastus sp.]
MAQFVFDMMANEGPETGLNIFDEYKDSEKFYFKSAEFLRAVHTLHQGGHHEDADALFGKAASYDPSLVSSLTNTLFSVLLKDGAGAGEKWLENNGASKTFRVEEYEFELACKTLYSKAKIHEGKVLTEFFKQRFPDSEEAYEYMADFYLAEDRKTEALQEYRDGLNRKQKNSFFKLAVNPPTKYVPTVLPRDPTKLFKTSGNLDSNKVFIFVQGGPDPDFGVYREDPLTLLPNQDGILRVNVKEAQIINTNLLASDPILTEKQCLFEHRKSAEMLHRTVEYFKSQGKKVFVLGHSYGCLIGIEYLRSQPNTADRVILMGSSFDQDLRNYPDSIKGQGKLIRWVDGVEPYEKSFFGDFPLRPLIEENLNRIFANTDAMVASHSKQRFTKILKGRDLSNVIFAYAKFDESSGRTKQYELDFLKSHGAKIIESYGDHHSMLSREVLGNVYSHVINGERLKKSVASELANEIEKVGVTNAIENYKRNKESVLLHQPVEMEINVLGYQLIKNKKLDEAIEILKLNAELFPNSWNTFDSLGEAYLAAKRFQSAADNYKRSLEIHPGNMFALAALKRIAEMDKGKREEKASNVSLNAADQTLFNMFAAVDGIIRSVMAEEHLPGAAIGIVKIGKTVFKRGCY